MAELVFHLPRLGDDGCPSPPVLRVLQPGVERAIGRGKQADFMGSHGSNGVQIEGPGHTCWAPLAQAAGATATGLAGQSASMGGIDKIKVSRTSTVVEIPLVEARFVTKCTSDDTWIAVSLLTCSSLVPPRLTPVAGAGSVTA